MPEDAARSDDPSLDGRSGKLRVMSPFARAIVLWSAIGALLLAAFGSAIGIAQREVYSPRGLVGAYLDALADRDAQAAMALPGVAMTAERARTAALAPGASHELLRSDVLARLGHARVVRDDELPQGEHQVTADFDLDGEPASMSFLVERAGSVLGLFQNWRFAVSPLAVAEVGVLHAETFDLGRHTLNARAANRSAAADFNEKADYLVFAPGRYRLGHHSRYLSAAPVTVTVTEGSKAADVTVETRPTRAFTRRVQAQLNRYLDRCVAQKVLQPTGCPMGVEVDDRVEGAPAWRMSRYPAIRIVATASGWRSLPADGAANVTMTVRSLFDGTISKKDEEEPFTVTLSSIAIRRDGTIDLAVAP